MPRLSVAIVAFNEEENIAKTLESVQWADEIVVVDSGSTDRTREIATTFGARIVIEPWKGYGHGVNSAIDWCSGDWILNLDADEWVTPELAASIQQVVADPATPFQAWFVPRLNRIFGRWMRHGGLYPDHKLRLFHAGTARLREDTEPHATPKTSLPTGTLKGDLLHNQYATLAEYLAHMDAYSTASIPLMLRRKRTSLPLPTFLWNTVLNPAATFLYNYILRAGFLDGREGLIFHLNHSLYIHWKYIKAWMAATSHPAQSKPPQKKADAPKHSNDP